MPKYARMVCLVGENPLPIYLGVLQFAKLDAEIVLVHSGKFSEDSEGTGKVAWNIKELLEEKGFTTPCQSIRLDNPWSPQEVLQKLAPLRGTATDPVVLNYTGGTKVMSAFSVIAWLTRHPEAQNALIPLLQNAFYLNDGERAFEIGMDEIEPLQVDFSAEDVARLHGVSRIFPEGSWNLSLESLLNLLKRWLPKEFERFNLPFPPRDPNNKSAPKEKKELEEVRWQEMRPGYQTRWNDFRKHLAPADKVGPNWQFLEGTLQDYKKEFDKRRKFANGTWLERLVWQAVRHVPQADDILNVDQGHSPALLQTREILLNRHFHIGTQEFESDIVIAHKRRLRYISVTTRRDPDDVKSKMFEAIYRSEQIGGGMARCCVVSLAGSDRCSACYDSLGRNPRYRFFGKDDLLRWFGLDENGDPSGWPGEVSELKAFLTD